MHIKRMSHVHIFESIMSKIINEPCRKFAVQKFLNNYANASSSKSIFQLNWKDDN